MHWNLHHRLEAARGLDSTEDLYMPGDFQLKLAQGESVSFTATIEATPQSAAIASQKLRQHEAELLEAINVANHSPPPPWIEQLALAADQFIVTRHATPEGKTIIAGYPWFADWGRDTMIALPGMTLATGRAQIAADILRTFARHVDQGLLPNRFPDNGEAPEYNAVDATLWYFVAIYEYLRATSDLAFAREIYPVLTSIIDWHQRGTRHGIVVDSIDHLLRAGAPGLQLTWMDAKVDQWVVTPRMGKAVEINALWCNALWIIGRIATQIGDTAAAHRFESAAQTTRDSFCKLFWFEDGQHLYDVIDSPQAPARDSSLRPNQMLALALPHRLLDDARARLVLRVCERELLTSYGLRTLNPSDPRYVPHYDGDQRQRDGAYHQGTVWPWLLGAFARAHFSLYGDRHRAASYLAPLQQHLSDACVGQISEIFDADPPHAPQGCVAQAWSVAQILATWLHLSSAQE
jgi:predicted glycogen debranching enzyme